jgi:hypothetical protein
MLLNFVVLIVLSIFAGILGALVGIGGGIIIVPALTLLFNVPIHYAVAASLVSVIATSIAGAHSYVEQQITNVRLGMFLEISTTFGALFGAVLSLILHGWMISIIFGALVMFMAVFSYLTRSHDDKMDFENDKIDENKKLESYLSIKGKYFDKALNKEIHYQAHKPIAGSVVSLFAGIGSGLLGIGGGVIKVTAMNALMRVPMKVSVATSKFMIGLTAATSSVIYLITGSIDYFIVAPVAIGTMIGATFGSSLMNKFKSKTIKLIFTLIASYLALRMLLKGLSDGFGIHIF